MPECVKSDYCLARAVLAYVRRALEAVGLFRPAMGIGGERRPGQYPKIR
jgi:hypothetical protein